MRNTQCSVWLPRVGLAMVIAALLLDCGALLLDIVLGLRIVDGISVPESDLERSSMISGAANLAVPAAVLVCATLFVWWFYCSYRAIGMRIAARFLPIWAVVGWAVPGVNLIRPPAIMSEMTGRRETVIGWWMLWIVGAFVQVALRFISPANQLGWVYWQITALTANLVLIVSLTLALSLVATVDRISKENDRAEWKLAVH